MNRFSVCGVAVVSFLPCLYLNLWPEARTEPMRSVYVCVSVCGQQVAGGNIPWNEWQMAKLGLEGGLLFVVAYVCSKSLRFVSSKKCINNVFDNKALNRSCQLISVSLWFLLTEWLIFVCRRKITILLSLIAQSVALMDQGKRIVFTDKCSMENAFVLFKRLHVSHGNLGVTWAKSNYKALPLSPSVSWC